MSDSRAVAVQTMATSPARPDITYRLASTDEELEQAFALVRDAYVRVGLEQSGKQRVRLTKYHLLPDTKVFVAVATTEDNKEKVIGTVSVVPDSALGLPAEQVAAQAIAQLRQRGERPAEFVALASDDQGTQERAILKLIRLGLEYCRRNGYSSLIASLTQRHAGFYRRFVGFEPMGKLTPYDMGNGTPVQVHHLNLREAADRVAMRSEALERETGWRTFWQEEADEVLAEARPARPWNAHLLQYFTKLSGHLVDQLDDGTRQALSSEYGRFGWQFPEATATNHA